MSYLYLAGGPEPPSDTLRGLLADANTRAGVMYYSEGGRGGRTTSDYTTTPLTSTDFRILEKEQNIVVKLWSGDIRPLEIANNHVQIIARAVYISVTSKHAMPGGKNQMERVVQDVNKFFQDNQTPPYRKVSDGKNSSITGILTYIPEWTYIPEDQEEAVPETYSGMIEVTEQLNT